MSINKAGRLKSAHIMPNIPLIQQNRISGSPTLRRANKVVASEHSNDNTLSIKRRLERRGNHERRQKKDYVLFDRRQRGMHRRKHFLFKHVAANSAGLSDTKGKHINTTA